MNRYLQLFNELVAQGKVVEAIIILEGQIAAEHDHDKSTVLLAEYIDVIDTLTSSTPNEISHGLAQHALEFARARLHVTPIDYAKVVLKTLDRATEILAAIESKESLEEVYEENNAAFSQEAKDILIQLSTCSDENILEAIYKKKYSIETIEEIVDVLAHSEELSSDPQYTGISVRANGLIERIKFCNAFDAATLEIETLLTDMDEALRVFSLQQAESIIRTFATNYRLLTSERVEKLKEYLNTLNTLSTQISSDERESEANGKWNNFVREHGEIVDQLKQWKPSLNCDISAHLEKAQKFMLDLQGVMPSLMGAKIAKKAQAVAVDMGERMSKMAEERQKRYDLWALSSIRTAFDNGSKHKGVFDDEEAIGKVLIDSLGSIDLRLVTNEVQRAYSEVFEILFARLDKDMHKHGGKLFTLKMMQGVTKKQLTAF